MKDNYIVFSVADTAYALASQQVAHVEMVEHITPVPNATDVIDGVVFSRGEIVPALNLRARFGFPRIACDLRTRLLVVRHDGRTAGLLVDAARTPIYLWRAGPLLAELWAPIAIAAAGVLVGTIIGERILLGLSPNRFARIVGGAIGVLGLWLIYTALATGPS